MADTAISALMVARSLGDILEKMGRDAGKEQEWQAVSAR